MDTRSLAQPAHPSTIHHCCDEEFLGLLERDFSIDLYSLNKAFIGVPPAPKKAAIALCEWAIQSTKGDVDEAGKALRTWAKKNGRGAYGRRLLEAPESVS